MLGSTTNTERTTKGWRLVESPACVDAEDTRSRPCIRGWNVGNDADLDARCGGRDFLVVQTYSGHVLLVEQDRTLERDAFADLQRSGEQDDRCADFREVLGDAADLFVVRRHGSD